MHSQLGIDGTDVRWSTSVTWPHTTKTQTMNAKAQKVLSGCAGSSFHAVCSPGGGWSQRLTLPPSGRACGSEGAAEEGGKVWTWAQAWPPPCALVWLLPPPPLPLLLPLCSEHLGVHRGRGGSDWVSWRSGLSSGLVFPSLIWMLPSAHAPRPMRQWWQPSFMLSCTATQQKDWDLTGPEPFCWDHRSNPGQDRVSTAKHSESILGLWNWALSLFTRVPVAIIQAEKSNFVNILPVFSTFLCSPYT